MKRLLEQLAVLLDYPGEESAAHLETCLAFARDLLPEAEELLAGLRSYLNENPVWSAQELYTCTFDLNPVCALDVGYYLFGEDYQRGLFLAHLRESQEEVGLKGVTELPDHLPLVMRWLARVYGTELYTEMASECLLPVLRKMDEFLAGGTNPYRGVLQAIARVFERDLAERGISVAATSRPLPAVSGQLPMIQAEGFRPGTGDTAVKELF